jgi:hypothetical protein
MRARLTCVVARKEGQDMAEVGAVKTPDWTWREMRIMDVIRTLCARSELAMPLRKWEKQKSLTVTLERP